MSTVVYNMRRGDDKQVAATVVTLPNGKCVVSWPTSTIVYDSEQAARDVHIAHMGGRGEVTSFVLAQASDAFVRGYEVCYQDDCENGPFGSGPIPPDYIEPADRSDYEAGYRAMAANMYGHDWLEKVAKWKVAPGAGFPKGDR